MPVINKVRIVNFAYNKDSRIIPDTTFDFKSQDGLITLRNGGGKSIMAQVIMQPIVPMCSLGHNAKRRTFDSIFRKDKSPAYILIEWKLDGNKGYMTCGIAFKRVNQSDDEERKGNLDYYTFIMDRSNCDLNITNTKLTSVDGKSIKVKDYYDVKAYLESHGARLYKMDSEFYRNNLMSYNIYPKEWKNIIAKINGDEGGLLKLFENSVTSKELTVNWIIKTIKENLSSNSSINQIMEQTENHILNSRKRMEDMKNRKNITAYMDRLMNFNQDFEKLSAIEKEYAHSKNSIYSMKYSLEELISKYKTEIEEMKVQGVQVEEKLKEIWAQEESFKYYELSDEKNEILKEKASLIKEIDNSKAKLEKSKLLLRSLKIASVSEEMKRATDTIEEYRARKDKLSMAESEITSEVSNLGYSLNTYYKQLIDSEGQRLQSIKEKLQEVKKEKEEKSIKIAGKRKEREELLKKSMQYEGRIKLLGENIDELLSQLSESGLLLALSGDEVERKISEARSEIESYEALEKEVSSSAEECALKIKRNEEDQLKCDAEIKELESEYMVITNELNNLEENIAAIKDDLDKNNIDLTEDNMESVMEILKTRIKDLEDQIYKAMDEKRRLKERLENSYSGGINISKEFLKYLDDNGADYELGSTFIREEIKTEEHRRELLSRIPLLPYCIITDIKTINMVKDNASKEFFDFPVFLIEREAIFKEDEPSKENLVSLCGGINIITMYDRELIVGKNPQEIRERLQEDIAVIDNNLGLWKKQMENYSFIQRDLSKIIDGSEHIESLKFRTRQIKEALRNANKEAADMKNEAALLSNRNDKLKNELEEIAAKKQKEFTTVKLLNDMYKKVSDRQDTYSYLESVKSELKINEELISRSESEIEKLKISDTELRTDIIRSENNLQKTRDLQREFTSYEDGNLIEEEPEKLTARYHSLKDNNAGGDINEFNRKISECSEIEAKCKERLEALAVKSYEKIKYDFALEQDTEKERDFLTEKINGLMEKKVNMDRDINDKEKLMTRISMGISPYEIKKREFLDQDIKNKKSVLETRKEVILVSLKGIMGDIDKSEKLSARISDSPWFEANEYKTELREPDRIPLEGMDKLYDSEVKKIKTVSNEKELMVKKIKADYLEMRNDFIGNNQIIDISLNTIEKEIDSRISGEMSKLISKQTSLMEIMLKKLSTDLSILDNEQQQIISNYVDTAKVYTEELMKIDKNSMLSMGGRSRKMMVIEKLRYDNTSQRLLESYIKQTIDALVSNEALNEELLLRAVTREFSIEILLQHFCRLDEVLVKFYKVEENSANSEYKKWEEMLPDNSGGEKFVSFFILLATLINYSRDNYLNKDQSSMAIIMDNPFAAISSQHLLIPVFEYAKQNNIQLICLSDHDKIDIVDRFNTIIRLAITPLTNKKEIIEVEGVDSQSGNYDEVIDEGYYNYSEQMTLV